jgi:formate hydrogenlyase subunit 3/multisubunit Na+/H+ antiporter MnhD subunit
MLLMLLMVLPFAAALMLALGARSGRRMHVGIAAGASAAGLALLLLAAPAVLAGTPLTARIAWIPTLGLDLSLWLDPLGLLFAGLILGIGLLVVIYAQGYLAKAEPTGRFLSFLMLFQGAMIGIALSNNILLMLIFWELTSLSSFLLGTAAEEVPGDYVALPFEIGFNSRYLMDILAQIDGDMVEVHLADAAAPTLIRENDKSPALYVLMPMRV